MEWGEPYMISDESMKKEQFSYQSETNKDGTFQLCTAENSSVMQNTDNTILSHAETSNGSINTPSLASPSTKDMERFNGLTEEDVKDKSLPDHLKENLDIVIVGINPSLASAHVGHHYAGPGNHFWTCLFQAGLVPMAVSCYDDVKMMDYGIGFTNVCTRPTKGAAELTRKEMKAGAVIMLEKMRKYRPKIAVFNGKGIYEAYVGHKNFSMGRQPAPLDGTNTVVFVMPSSSARCAQLPRAEDKLPFFVALRKLRDYLRGDLPELPDSEVVFADYTEFRVTQPDPKSVRKAERRRKRKAEAAAAAALAAAIAADTASGADGDTLINDLIARQAALSDRSEQGIALSSTGLSTSVTTTTTNMTSGGIAGDVKPIKSKSKSSKKKRTSEIVPNLTQSQQNMQLQSVPNASFTTCTSDLQLQQQQQQQQQQFQQQQAFFLQQQQQQLQQFAQPISQQQQHAALQQAQQQQVIVSGGQLMSATPMVTLAMAAGPGGTAIPVHPGTPAGLTAGCYAAPQFQFSGTPGGATQQFFISPQNPNAAGAQTFLHWSAAPGTPGTIHFQQPQPAQQAWQAVSSMGGALYAPQHQTQQHQQAVGATLQSATTGGSSVTAAQQSQLLAQQAAGTTVQMAQQHQQHQPVLFAPQHAVGLQAPGQAAAYPQQIYFAQAPAGVQNSGGTSYHLLPVGCPTSNFTSLLLSEHQQQAQLAQCTNAAAQLQRTQPTIHVQTAQQAHQFSQQQQQQQPQQQAQLQAHHFQQQQQQQAYIQAQPQTTAMLAADMSVGGGQPGGVSAGGSAPQFITLAPGAPLKVMAVGPNGQLIQTTGLPQFMPATATAVNMAFNQQQQQPQALQSQSTAAMTAQHRATTPQQQSNGRTAISTAAFFSGTNMSSGTIPLVQTAAGSEDLITATTGANVLGAGDEKLVYTAL